MAEKRQWFFEDGTTFVIVEQYEPGAALHIGDDNRMNGLDSPAVVPLAKAEKFIEWLQKVTAEAERRIA